ncbi:MAG: UvrD-helicase domain-containing protein [Clostridia bacterium]|nr:UvrD-helicase domain-containing protein [Clostridia bacterium]
MSDLNQRFLRAKRALFEKAYGNLNEKQRDAVFTVNHPLLVLAGAGSGKTTVLVQRVAFLIRYGNAYYGESVNTVLSESYVTALEQAVQLPTESILPILSEFICDPCPPWRVLAITFTNKAANEIKARLASSFDDPTIANEIWAGTFHSICMRILRKFGDRVGYAPGFSVYDTEDSKKAITTAMKACRIDDKTLPIRSVQNAISRAKDKLMTPSDMAAEAGTDFRMKQIARVYEEYQRQLKSSNALDFDDIIMQTVLLLQQDEEVRTQYQKRFRYICVDEYQDTNEAQFTLTAILAAGSRNLMVVGDDDQSIYRFRGATIENILNFDRVFSDAKVIKLEQNYRSTQNILDGANAVISNNSGRKGKTLWTANGCGEKIHLKKTDDGIAEARFMIDVINKKVESGDCHFRDFAVLYRTNAQSANIERTFAKSGIPYRMLGGVRFTDRKEIRDLVAYLQLINNHNDRERMMRIINEPRRKIGDKTLEAVEAIAIEQQCGIFDVLQQANRYVALSRAANALMSFAALIEELTELSKTVSLETLINETLDRSGYRQMIKDMGEEEAERLDNIGEFISGAVEYEENNEESSLAGFLEETALVADVDRYDETADAVVLMTIHSAKGLEFPIVFLPGMEDGLFPGMQTIMGGDAEMEEERRLAYVAITRAKRELYILHANSRMLYGRTQYNPPSRFLKEIPEELIDNMTPPPKAPAAGGQVKTYYSAKPQYQQNVTVNKNLFKTAEQGAGKTLFEVGDRVSHLTFGIGEILSVKQMGADKMYEIVFDKAGTKKLMASFAKLKKLN